MSFVFACALPWAIRCFVLCPELWGFVSPLPKAVGFGPCFLLLVSGFSLVVFCGFAVSPHLWSLLGFFSLLGGWGLFIVV